ncbi:hypothetical protein C2E23DRAFT_863231 [Lenzites betulinus]|nr:hypothetical protein C2E23DRAFT_863231 [Lenzites betulinus]
MPSYLTALALVVLVPALICGATPIGTSSAQARSPDVAINPSGDPNQSAPPPTAKPGQGTVTNYLLSCLGDACTDSCVLTALDDLPRNQCNVINGGVAYTSLQILQVTTSEGSSQDVPADFQVFVGTEDCEFFTLAIPDVGGCHSIFGNAVSGLQIFPGTTPTAAF